MFIICLFKKKRCATPVIGIQKSCILSCESIKSYCWNDQLLLISNVRERRRFYGMSTKSNFSLKKIFLLWNTFIMIREPVFCFKLCHSLPTRCRIPKLCPPPPNCPKWFWDSWQPRCRQWQHPALSATAFLLLTAKNVMSMLTIRNIAPLTQQ